MRGFADGGAYAIGGLGRFLDEWLVAPSYKYKGKGWEYGDNIHQVQLQASCWV